jgi:hypothetical protein
MKEICAIILMGFLLPIVMFSQYKHDYTWLVGYPITEPSDFRGVSVFNFNNDTLKLTKQDEGISMYVTNTSYSSQDGELMFYTNGCKVFNANHVLMENGNGLNPGDAYLTGNCPDGGNAIPKGIMAIQMPNDDSKVYLFHQATEYGDLGTYIAYFYYTIIDMEQDNGLGAVVEKNQLIVSDTMFSDLHAVKHANGEDWWFLFSKENKNQFFKVLFTQNGVEEVYTQEIGIDPTYTASASGQSSFSPDGTMYARMNAEDQVTLFDFDRETGELSNFRQLVADTMAFWTSLSFSPNSRYLYVSTTWKLWQFDLLAPDIQASKVLIDEYDGFTYFGFPMIFFLMQLGPDCKIYMIGTNGTKFMHVINRPDEPGQACDFRQHSLELPSINNTSIPNFPNYRLGTGYPVCDSNIVYTAGRFISPPPKEVEVWPNPASREVRVSLPAAVGSAGRITLSNSLGETVRVQQFQKEEQQVLLFVDNLSNGLYFITVMTEMGKVTKPISIIH